MKPSQASINAPTATSEASHSDPILEEVWCFILWTWRLNLLLLCIQCEEEADDISASAPPTTSEAHPAPGPFAAPSTSVVEPTASWGGDGPPEPPSPALVKTPSRPVDKPSSGNRVADMEIEIGELRRKLERAETK